MTLEKLLEKTEYTLISGDIKTEITDVIYDSRKVVPGCAFVCLVGSAVDGHKFAADAAAAGAAALIISEDIEVPEGAAVVKVEDTRAALAVMSAAYFGHPADELITVGITGTKGKTTTTALIRSILEAGGIKTGTIGTLGIIIGDELIKTNNTTPESYEIQSALRKMADSGCKCCVIEASSLGLKWHRLDGFVFDWGIFTNFSHDHIGGVEHPTMEDYRDCKAMLFRSHCRHGLFNADDSAWEYMAKDSGCTVQTYGCSEKADMRASGERLLSRPGYLGVHFDVSGLKRLGGGEVFSADVAIPGMFTVHNALAAIAFCEACVQLGIDGEAVRRGLDHVMVKGRVEIVKVPGDYTLIIDYAHNAVSMENILTTLREYHPSRLVTLFGAGGNRPRDRRFEMGEISGRLSDLSVITEDNSRFEDVNDIIADIVVGVNKSNGKYITIPDRTDAIRWCIENAQSGDIVVLAGKGHEDYMDKNGVKTHYDERDVIRAVIGG